MKTLRAFVMTASLAIVGTMQSSLAAEPCSRPAEQTALNVRALQTDLMVAALVCGMRAEYDTFMLAYRERFGRHAVALRTYFKRAHGASGEFHLNRLVTRLANEASSASATDRGLYCRSAGAMFDALDGATAPVLDGVIREPLLAARHGIAACAEPANSDKNRLSVRPVFQRGGSELP